MIENPNKKFVQLLADHATGKISTEELDKECAYWYMDCFLEVNPKPFPTPPPRFSEYQNSSYEEKKEYNNNFWLLPEIKSYVDQKESIKQENEDNVYKLKSFLKYIPEEDFVSRNKYEQKIRDFEHHK